MRLYKKTKNVALCKSKVIVFQHTVDSFKSDKDLYNKILKPSLSDVLEESDYVAVLGLGFNTKFVSFKSIEALIDSCKIQPFKGGFLTGEDVKYLSDFMKIS